MGKASEDAGAEILEGPWNPGLNSSIPRRFLHLSTMFRPENVFTSLAEAEDLSDFTGIAPKDLVVFRPERLVVHELLIRIMADVSVPDGSHYGDLGINFRQYSDAVLDRHIAPQMDRIASEYDALSDRAGRIADNYLDSHIAAEASEPAGWWARLTGSGIQPAKVQPSGLGAGRIRDWTDRRKETADLLEAAVLDALIRTATAISGKHGRILGDNDLIKRVALTFVMNPHGSQLIGELIAPLVEAAIAAEGLRPLPIQAKPVIMNVKGASAAGKSTLRPLQQMLAERIGVNWHDFALISPDIWRKYMLEYASLGDAYKYAGMLTGHELEIVDRKLDRYMAEKAVAGKIPHLLIDRFRFDSFAAQPGEADGGRLLTRFGDLVYMFFVITPPEATVERAWDRGLEYGRYKAVDDLLDHNIEAFTGMPRLFFTWALNTSKRVHYEFLDNSVSKGERPRTIAFGWNGEMTVFDIKRMLNIDRYAKINVDAATPDEVYEVEASLAPEENSRFLTDCAAKLSVLTLAQRETGKTYAEIREGKPAWVDSELLAEQCADSDVRAGLTALLGTEYMKTSLNPEKTRTLNPAACHTLGRWGSGA
ncbi:MAG: hypothetical protein AAF441_15230 [Pseudomonadota bacterium]